jgi:predicted hydrocarbon binding protein
MATSGPQVPITVDSDSGIWTTDGIPMIYMPRHFFVNHLQAFEAAMGAEAFAKVTYAAGHASAWQWCDKESKTHGLRGTDVFVHYMNRISQRGWGRFAITALDRDTGAATVALEHSVYVEHFGRNAGRRLCGAFDGWFAGALEWAGRDGGRDWRLVSRETQCAGMGHAHCVFQVQEVTQ